MFRIVDFAVLVDHRVKFKLDEKIYRYLEFAWKLKKLRNMKVTAIPIVIGVLGTIGVLGRNSKGTGRLRNHSKSRDHADYSISQIAKNT